MNVNNVNSNQLPPTPPPPPPPPPPPVQPRATAPTDKPPQAPEANTCPADQHTPATAPTTRDTLSNANTPASDLAKAPSTGDKLADANTPTTDVQTRPTRLDNVTQAAPQADQNGFAQAYQTVSGGMDWMLKGTQQNGDWLAKAGQNNGVPDNVLMYGVNVVGEGLDLVGSLGQGIGSAINGTPKWLSDVGKLGSGQEQFSWQDASAAAGSSIGKFAYGLPTGAVDLAARVLAPGHGHDHVANTIGGVQNQATQWYEGQVTQNFGVNTNSTSYKTTENGLDVAGALAELFMPGGKGKPKGGGVLTTLDNAPTPATATRLANSADNISNLGRAVDDFKAGKIDAGQLNDAIAQANDAYQNGGGKGSWDANTKSDYKRLNNDAQSALANTPAQVGSSLGSTGAPPKSSLFELPTNLPLGGAGEVFGPPANGNPFRLGPDKPFDAEPPGALVKYTGPLFNPFEARTIIESTGTLEMVNPAIASRTADNGGSPTIHVGLNQDLTATVRQHVEADLRAATTSADRASVIEKWSQQSLSWGASPGGRARTALDDPRVASGLWQAVDAVDGGHGFDRHASPKLNDRTDAFHQGRVETDANTNPHAMDRKQTMDAAGQLVKQIKDEIKQNKDEIKQLGQQIRGLDSADPSRAALLQQQQQLQSRNASLEASLRDPRGPGGVANMKTGRPAMDGLLVFLNMKEGSPVGLGGYFDSPLPVAQALPAAYRAVDQAVANNPGATAIDVVVELPQSFTQTQFSRDPTSGYGVRSDGVAHTKATVSFTIDSSGVPRMSTIVPGETPANAAPRVTTQVP